MEQKNGIQDTLRANGIMFKIDEAQGTIPEIISEDTFIMLLQMNMEDMDALPMSIDDEGYEDEDLDDDGLIIG